MSRDTLRLCASCGCRDEGERRVAVATCLCTDRRGQILARAVIGLLADERARRSMGAAAAERCRSLFGIDTIAPQYLELYRELVTQ